jgi:acetyl-CoA synthetase
MTDYDAERARFRWEVPQRFNAVLDIVERRAERSPNDLALVALRGDGGVATTYTFRELNLASRRMGHALAGLGVSGMWPCSARSGSAPSRCPRRRR